MTPGSGCPSLAARWAAASAAALILAVAEGGAPSRGAFYSGDAAVRPAALRRGRQGAQSRGVAGRLPRRSPLPALLDPQGPVMAAPPTGQAQVSGRWFRDCLFFAREDPGSAGLECVYAVVCFGVRGWRTT